MLAELWNNDLFSLSAHIIVLIGVVLVLLRVKTRSKESIAAEKRAREQVSQILESITDGFVAIDRDWRFTYVNNEGEKLLGKMREEMVGRSVFEVIPDMEGSTFHRKYAKAMERRVPVVFEEHSLLVDKYFAVHAYPAENGVSVYFRDVTAERRAQAALRRSEERYRELFENANDLLYMHDLVGNFTSVNNACVTATGYTHDELLGMNLSDLVAPDQLDKARQMLLQKIQQGGGATTYELEIIARDGRRLPLEVSTRLVMDDGRPISVQGIARDISERKRAEEALRNLSLTDALTGVYNRRGALTLADQQLKVAHRVGRKMMLLYADMNHLKLINDTRGHATGDAALVETAQILQDTFRESDIVARMGGDEFLILAVETEPNSEESLRRRLAERLETRNLEFGHLYPLDLSIGVAHFDPNQPRSFEELVMEADEKMYKEKRDLSRRAEPRERV